MKSLAPILFAGLLMVAGVSLVGCSSSNQQNPPPDDRGGTAGGNGAFGESSARPGSHEGDQYNQQGAAPATQPSSGY